MTLGALIDSAPTVDCAALINARDAVPGRAPLSLLSELATRLRKRSVVVIGDGSTDGINCLAASGATSATSATIDEHAVDCDHLMARANDANLTFKVHCRGLLDHASVPDADLYTWSQSSWRAAQWRFWLRRGVTYSSCRKYFGNCATGSLTSAMADPRAARLLAVDSFDVLAALRRLQSNGQIRPSAEFAITLDDSTDGDLWTLHKLRDMRGWLDWNSSHCVSTNESGDHDEGSSS